MKILDCRHCGRRRRPSALLRAAASAAKAKRADARAGV
jgi:hypothetical protein